MRSLLLVVLLGTAVALGQSSSGSSESSSAPQANPPSADQSSSTQSSSDRSNSDQSSTDQSGSGNSKQSSGSSSNSGSSAGAAGNSQKPASSTNKPFDPISAAPRSDTVNGKVLEDGESSSTDSLIDLNPPASDLKAHPNDAGMLKDEGLKDEGSTGSSGSDIHPWDPHRAAKDIEVGDFYFKQKNYVGAADRYREALFYKDNDAIATFHLAQCLEKLQQPADAKKEYENYLKILPNGPEAEKAHKAIDRLSASAK